MMGVPLRVLIIEDNSADAELMLHALVRAGFDPVSNIVESEQGFLDCLQMAPEVILADFSLPDFSALDALKILQESNLDIPCIIVSGSLGEERAVEILKQGAADYLMKDALGRLGPAVKMALEKKVLRDGMRLADQQLRHSACLLTLSAEVAIALTKDDTIPEMLGQCAESLIRNLDAAFARIWTFNRAETELHAAASAGIDGVHLGAGDPRGPGSPSSGRTHCREPRPLFNEFGNRRFSRRRRLGTSGRDRRVFGASAPRVGPCHRRDGGICPSADFACGTIHIELRRRQHCLGCRA